MKVDGDYTGKFADPFYGYDPDVAFTQETTSYAAFIQDEWSFSERWKLIGGLRYWHDTREGSYFGSAPEVPGLTPPVTIIFGPDEIFPNNPDVLVSTADAERDFDDVTARLELDLPAERGPAPVRARTTAAARAAASRFRPARRTTRTKRNS